MYEMALYIHLEYLNFFFFKLLGGKRGKKVFVNFPMSYGYKQKT